MHCYAVDQAKSMVHTIHDNSNGLRGSAKAGTKVSTKSCAMEHMEKNIVCLDQGLESMSCACKQGSSSSESSFYLRESVKA